MAINPDFTGNANRKSRDGSEAANY